MYTITGFLYLGLPLPFLVLGEVSQQLQEQLYAGLAVPPLHYHLLWEIVLPIVYIKH